uniref:Uncharacterized protein n=1 Tax=Anopheles atroparvus TaxID=41427 RepID=A0A182INC9_ANOAO
MEHSVRNNSTNPTTAEPDRPYSGFPSCGSIPAWQVQLINFTPHAILSPQSGGPVPRTQNRSNDQKLSPESHFGQRSSSRDTHQRSSRMVTDSPPEGRRVYSISGTSTSLIALQATGGPTCPGVKSPCTVRVIGAPSHTRQPRAARENASTASERGAEPTTIRRSRPPKPSCIFRNTSLSQMLFRRTMPRLISASFELSAMFSSIFLNDDRDTSANTLSYTRLSRRGTAGISVGFSAFMSFVSSLMSPEKNPTAPPM